MEQVKVVLSSVVTWLVVVATVAGIVVEELVSAGVDGAWDPVLSVLGVIGTVALTAVAIIRRVEPVLPEERGILPPS